VQNNEWCSMLNVTNLNAFYGKAQILFDLQLQVQKGEVVALMGRNGAGKSTTLKSIMGLIEDRSGAVQFLERDIARLQSHEIARLGLGYIPEDRRIFTELTVHENLEIGRKTNANSSNPWTIERLFKLFPNLAQMPNRMGGSMSGGEQQMLTVARTLMGNPQCVLMDEPSEGVAPVIVEQMAESILTMKAEGISVLLCEQNIHFAQQVADRVYVLEKGQIAYSATMQELVSNQVLRRQYLGI
jgi:branched-chain amino acid transport system ATP-binding protein